MNYFDLHCDTLTTCFDKSISIKENNLHFSINNSKCFDIIYQTFAIFINEKYKGVKAFDRYLDIYKFYKSINFENVKSILSIENATCLNGDINNISLFAFHGVRFMSLTWNSENQLGGGADTNVGLTDFGADVIREMESCNIVLDVSHLSEKAFWDAYNVSKKPIVATHSNAYKICKHKRNLKDNQIKAIIDTDGVIGVNLYPKFLSNKDNVEYGDILSHIAHFLKLGCENHISLGTDFDGATMDSKWNNISKMPNLYKIIENEFGISIADKIFFTNAKNFFDKYVNIG